jgi:hypothetical protein
MQHPLEREQEHSDLHFEDAAAAAEAAGDSLTETRLSPAGQKRGTSEQKYYSLRPKI